MAKRGRKPRTDSALVGFAEDLGKLLGTARSRAEGWLGQREQIAKQLTGIRDTATDLLQQLTGAGAAMVAAARRGRRGRPPGSTNKRGRPGSRKRGRRGWSAAQRKAAAERMRKYWANRKAGEKRK